MTLTAMAAGQTATRSNRIAFTRPSLDEAECEAVLRVLHSGQLGGNGPIGHELERLIQTRFGVRRALLTTSCTHALEMAAMVLKLRPGDEVIMPSFGFVTAATAIIRQGARPVFAEVLPTTYNLDPADVQARITPRTRAMLCVHYAGQGCDMDALLSLARAYDLAVIEDAAQGVGSRFNGRYLGTIGDVGGYSFHVTKNVTCGEGGAFLTNDVALAERAEILREKGTDRSKFLRGEVDKYTWVDEGSSFVLSDVLAAIALTQFKKLDVIQQRRQAVWQRYQTALTDLELAGCVHLPVVDDRAEPNWHIYACRVAVAAERDRVLAELKQRGIDATFHFVPLHSSPYSRQRWGYRPEDLPVTEQISASLIRLPIYPELTADDQDYIVEAVHQAFRA